MTQANGKEIRVVIVDDEPLARDLLRLLLAAAPDVEIVAECANGRETIDAIRGQTPDLVFLDVQMPDMNGLEVVSAIGPERMPPVIFVTAYDEFAVKAFEIHAVDYLLKPFDEARFGDALARARRHLHQSRVGDLSRKLAALLDDYRDETGSESARPRYVERLPVRRSGRVIFLRVDEIDWVEAAGDYVMLHVGEREYALHSTMHAIQSQLDPRYFIRIHRSIIVNIDRIHDFKYRANGRCIVNLHDGTELKATRTYRKNLDRLLNRDR